MRLLPQMCVPIFLAIATYAQQAVHFCDLVRNPEEYNGKTVTVRATYRQGFEWRELYCLECLDKGKAWLELPDDYNLDTASAKALKRVPKAGGIVNLTVQGVFVSGGHFGHENGYHYKFVVVKVADVKVLLKGMKNPEEERIIEQRYACGGTNPK